MSTLARIPLSQLKTIPVASLRCLRKVTIPQQFQKPESLEKIPTFVRTLSSYKIYQPSRNLLSANSVLPSLTVYDGGVYSQQKRFYRKSVKPTRSEQQNQDGSQPPESTPQLMDIPEVFWPSMWDTIRNGLLYILIDLRFKDQEFSYQSFRVGAIQALVHVSQELSKGNFDALEGLITKPSLQEIQKNFNRLSLKQRLDLAVKEEDIFFSFPHKIDMFYTNEGSKNERVFVEITMCYHIFRGIQEYLAKKAEGSTSKNILPNYETDERFSIANYRFTREFTKGVEDDWTISLANHFKP